MDKRGALNAELDTASETELREVYDFLRFIKSKAWFPGPPSASPEPRYIPDFEARRKALFGVRVFEDSVEILDDIRGDRF